MSLNAPFVCIKDVPTNTSEITSRLPIALLGASGYGALHLNTLLSLQEKGLVELAAIADPAISRLPDLRATLEQKGVAYYEKPEELLQRGDI